MSEPVRHLELVNPETGEISDGAPSYPDALQLLRQLETQIEMMERDLKGKRLRIAQLEADREAAALASPHRPQVELVYALWKRACGKRRALHFSDREAIEAAIKKMGLDTCMRAVVGAKFDPFTKRQRNGKQKAFDDLETIFRTFGRVSDFAGRAPTTWEPDAEKIAAIGKVEISKVEEWLGRKRDVGLGTASAGATSPSASASSAESGAEGRAA